MIITLIGFVAGILNTAYFLPQVIKSWKTRHTKDLSLPMYLLNAGVEPHVCSSMTENHMLIQQIG